MARRRPKSKRSQPVQPKKVDDGKIKIPKQKPRSIPPPKSRFHRDKSRYTRRSKYGKGNRGC